jgi:hypothetical protein
MCGYFGSFLDTAPEDGGPERLRELLEIIKRYFEKELANAEDEKDSRGVSSSELVLATLSAAIKRIPTQEQLEELEASVLNGPPATAEDVEGWHRFERFLEQEGKKGWWD